RNAGDSIVKIGIDAEDVDGAAGDAADLYSAALFSGVVPLAADSAAFRFACSFSWPASARSEASALPGRRDGSYMARKPAPSTISFPRGVTSAAKIFGSISGATDRTEPSASAVWM